MLEQVFRPGVCLDGMKDNANALGQLIEERLMCRIETLERRKFHDCFYFSFEQDRQDHDISRARFAEARAHFHITGRHVDEKNTLFFQRCLPNQALSQFEMSLYAVPFGVSVTGQKLEFWLVRRVAHNIEDAVLGGNHRGQFRQDKFANRQQVPLPLQHARELGEIGFEPVLLLVAQGRFFQIADHFIDVVLHECDFTLRFHLDRSREIACRHRGRDIGDGAKLSSQVCRQTIYIVGQIAPRAGGAGHAGLTT